MKRLMIILFFFLILPFIVPVPVQAAEEAVKDELLRTRAAIAANRTRIVMNTLQLSEKEIEAFTPVYENYWGELNEINDRLSDLILDYSEHYQNLTDEKALFMLDEMLDIQKKKVDLRRKYVKRFKKVLTPKRLVMFYQLENKMDVVVMVELVREVPLVR